MRRKFETLKDIAIAVSYTSFKKNSLNDIDDPQYPHIAELWKVS